MKSVTGNKDKRKTRSVDRVWGWGVNSLAVYYGRPLRSKSNERFLQSGEALECAT